MLAGVTCAHAPESTAHGTCAHTSFWSTLLISAERVLYARHRIDARMEEVRRLGVEPDGFIDGSVNLMLSHVEICFA